MLKRKRNKTRKKVERIFTLGLELIHTYLVRGLGVVCRFSLSFSFLFPLVFFFFPGMFLSG